MLHTTCLKLNIDFAVFLQSHIKELTNESFQNHKDALATKRLEKPKKMSGQNARFWNEIISQQYNFERGKLHRLIKLVNNLSYLGTTLPSPTPVDDF